MDSRSRAVERNLSTPSELEAQPSLETLHSGPKKRPSVVGGITQAPSLSPMASLAEPRSSTRGEVLGEETTSPEDQPRRKFSSFRKEGESAADQFRIRDRTAHILLLTTEEMIDRGSLSKAKVVTEGGAEDLEHWRRYLLKRKTVPIALSWLSWAVFTTWLLLCSAIVLMYSINFDLSNDFEPTPEITEA